MAQQKSILAEQQVERNSWREAHQEMVEVLGSFRASFAGNTGPWSMRTPSKEWIPVSRRLPPLTSSNSLLGNRRSPGLGRSSRILSTPPSSSSNSSDVEADRMTKNLSQQGGEFRMDLGAIDSSGQRLWCHGPLYDSAMRAKDTKEWCRHLMKGIYGESAKLYRVGVPRKSGLLQIPANHFQLIEGHYIKFLEDVKGVLRGSAMFDDLKRAFPETLGNVGDVMLRVSQRNEKRAAAKKSSHQDRDPLSEGEDARPESESQMRDDIGPYNGSQTCRVIPATQRQLKFPGSSHRSDMGGNYSGSETELEIPETERFETIEFDSDIGSVDNPPRSRKNCIDSTSSSETDFEIAH